MKLYVVCRVEEDGQWHILGVYDNTLKAERRCTNPNDFVGPLDLNKDLPDKIIDWPNAYYPSAKDKGCDGGRE